MDDLEEKEAELRELQAGEGAKLLSQSTELIRFWEPSDASGAPVAPTILAAPREIYKQSP